MICSEPERLADFYEAAFGFVRTDDATITEPAFAKLMDIPAAKARVITLRLGEQEIELAEVHPPGQQISERMVSGRSRSFSAFRNCGFRYGGRTRDCRHRGLESYLDRGAAVVAGFVGRRYRV